MRFPFSSDNARPWRQLARDLNAVFTGVGWFTAPTLRFQHGVHRVVVRSNSKRITFVATWPVRDVNCMVSTRSSKPRVVAGMHLQPVAMGESSFDERYAVRANDGDAAKVLLSPNVVSSLERVASLRLTSPVRLMFEPGSVTVEKHAKLTGYPALLSFIRTSLSLLDQAMLTRAEGIDFCEKPIEDDFLPVDEVMCQVCGDLIDDHDLVSCRRCHTPHHRECWDYYGSCTVYGCQESDYDTPEFAPLLRYVSGAVQEATEVATEGSEEDLAESHAKSTDDTTHEASQAGEENLDESQELEVPKESTSEHEAEPIDQQDDQGASDSSRIGSELSADEQTLSAEQSPDEQPLITPHDDVATDGDADADVMSVKDRENQ